MLELESIKNKEKGIMLLGRFVVMAVTCSMLFGCMVSKKRFEEIEESYRRSQSALQEAENSLSEANESILKEQKKSSDLGKRIQELEGELEKKRELLASGEADRQKLAGDLSKVVRDRSQLQESIEEMERALAELSARKAAADLRIAEFKNLVARFQELIDAGRLRVRIVDGRMVVEMASDVLFASGSSRLSEEGREGVKEVATVLADLPGRRFQVEGHTDNVPIRTAQFPSNWELASARAITVVNEMIVVGVPHENISAASFGEFKPAADNETPEGRAANRRIEIVLVPDLSTLPGFEELRRLSGE